MVVFSIGFKSGKSFSASPVSIVGTTFFLLVVDAALAGDPVEAGWVRVQD